MKKLIVFSTIMFACSIAFASYDVTVTISDAEKKVLEYYCRPGETVENIIRRAGRLIAEKKADRIIREKTEYNPNKLTTAQKVSIINGLTLLTGGAHE